MSFLQSLIDGYHDFLDTYGDPRMGEYPLMDSPVPTLVIIAMYIVWVKYVGPKWMENRKPFELKNTLIFYNLVEITISLIAIHEAYVVGWFTNYSWTCQPVDKSDTPLTRRLIRGVYLYYLSKYVELFDTIFFVLRKKNAQVSKLHVYHHSIMPLTAWITGKFVPGGHALCGGVLNSFVHVIMYSYYLLTALGPGMKKYLWWKRYLTVIQMGQFVIVFFHAMQLLFNDCDFPRPFAYFVLAQAAIFLILFKNFYDNTYAQNRKRAAQGLLVEDNSQKSDQLQDASLRQRKFTKKCEASR